jgi:hypothetical protein
MLEMELRQSDFLREVGSQLRPAELVPDLVPAAVLTARGDADARRPYPTALAAD